MIDAQLLFDMAQLWPMAKANYEALDRLQVKEARQSAPSILAMFNPERVRSTAARVDSASVSARPCFLCSANRPQEQRSILWRDYDVLVNPFPIFRHHLTIASRFHVPQDFDGREADMFALARELPGFSVFFNGPLCGASAPDHLHFQAGDGLFAPSPLQREVDASAQIELFSDADSGSVFVSEATGRLVYHVVARSEEGAAALIRRLFSLRRIRKDMMNVVARSRGEDAYVDFYFVPRRLFRPWQFAATDENNILISPAAVEVAGIFVLPRLSDFDALTPSLALDILTQVCYQNDSSLLP